MTASATYTYTKTAMGIPTECCAVRLNRITSNDDLVSCEKVGFLGGANSIDTVFRRARVCGRVEVGGDIFGHFADLFDVDGSLVETVSLDGKSYSALKNRLMRCRVEGGAK